METTDRVEFDAQMAQLCAAFNVPDKGQAAAYWIAFRRLSLIEFARIIEAALGPDGPEKMPTVKQLWRIRAELKTAAGPAGATLTPDLIERLITHCLTSFALSERQSRSPWSWITAPDGSCLGVIVPLDPIDARRYPEHRVMVADLPPPERSKAGKPQ